MTISSFASGKSIVPRYIAPTMLQQGGFKINSAVRYIQYRSSSQLMFSSLRQLLSTSCGTAFSTTTARSASGASTFVLASVFSNNEQSQFAVRSKKFFVWSPINKKSVHTDPLFGSWMTVMAYVILATGTGTMISLCDSIATSDDFLDNANMILYNYKNDPYENLPEEDEVTYCELCNKYRQGPCRPYWRKLERCIKDNRDGSASEKCKIYTMSHVRCTHPYRDLYRLIGMDGFKIMIDRINRITRDHERRCWGCIKKSPVKMEWHSWSQFVKDSSKNMEPMNETAVSTSTTSSSSSSSGSIGSSSSNSNQEKISTWKGIPYDMNQKFIPGMANIPFENAADDTNSPNLTIVTSWVVDQDDTILGIAINNKYKTEREQSTTLSKINNTKDDFEVESLRNKSPFLETYFTIVPGVTKEVRVFALYKENPHILEVGQDEDILLFSSQPYSLEKAAKEGS